MPYTFYLSKSEKGAINSGEEVEYFVTAIEIQPHTHPLYVGKCIDETATSLDRGPYSGYYDTVVAQWKGSIDEVLSNQQALVEQYEPIKDEWPAQYWDAEKKVKSLTEAKKIMAAGLVVNPFVE